MRESDPFRDTVLDWNINLVSRRMLQNLELHDKVEMNLGSSLERSSKRNSAALKLRTH
jgi:hypothetical protein